MRSCPVVLILLAAQVHGASLEWLWLGALTSTSVDFRLRSTAPVRVCARPATDSHAQEACADASPRAADGIYGARLEALIPATAYTYQAGDKEGSFRTPGVGRHNFSFAMSSCALTGSQHPVFEAMHSRAPLLMLHMGDLHYGDIETNDTSKFLAALDAVHGSPAQAKLYRDAPLAYMYDDHDFGSNNADSLSLSRDAAIFTYEEAFPHYPLAAPRWVEGRRQAVHQAFTIGTARFILTDLRAEMNAETVLGSSQEAWLLDELLRSSRDYDVVFWCSTMPWIDTAYKWGEYASWAAERTRIAKFIKGHRISNLFMLSGDAHMLAFDDGTHSEGGFPVFHAAPLDKPSSRKGGPYTHGAYAHDGGQYGIVDVQYVGKPQRVCVGVTGWRTIPDGTKYREDKILSWDSCSSGPASPNLLYTPPSKYQQYARKFFKGAVKQMQDYAGVPAAIVVTVVCAAVIWWMDFLG